MTLKEKIGADFITALKAKNAPVKSLLSVIRGEIQNTEKNVGVENLPDEDVLKILNKTLKSLNETISLLNDDNTNSNVIVAKTERDIVMCYLPKEMSAEEILNKVTILVNSGITNIGAIMKEFTGLQVDKKIVSETIKKIIK